MQWKKNGISTEIEDKTFDQVLEEYGYLVQKDIAKIQANNENLLNIAQNIKFSKIRDMHFSKDNLIEDKKISEDELKRRGSKRDPLINHLLKIEEILYYYENDMYNAFLKETDYRIRSISDKKILKENINELINFKNKTVEEVINKAHELKICYIDDRLKMFMDNYEYLYRRVKDINYDQIKKLYIYVEGYTPFSTQHKVKGDEYNNVLVILDNANWRNYNFESIFTGRASNEDILKRTKKIFYVCITRAKEKLYVFFSNPSTGIVSNAKELFGNENVVEISKIKDTIVNE